MTPPTSDAERFAHYRAMAASSLARRRTPMREHETSAPSLRDEDLIERACEASWAVARPYIAEHFRAGMDPGEYESQLAEDKAIARLEIAAVLSLFRSTAMAEAVASARAEGWQPIETAPANKAIQVYVPGLDYYGNGGVYAGMLVDMGTGPRWMTFAWAMGRDMIGDNRPTHWMPLPAPPTLIPGGSSDVGR